MKHYFRLNKFLFQTLILLGVSFSLQEGLSQVVIPKVSWDGILSYELDSIYIASKNISRIDYQLSSKNPSERIKSKAAIKYENYNEEGKIIESFYQRKIGAVSLIDHSLWKRTNGKMNYITYKDGTGYLRKYYTQSQNHTKSNTYRSESYNPETQIPENEKDSTLVNQMRYVNISENEIHTFNKREVHTRTYTKGYNIHGLIEKETLNYELSTTQLNKSFTYNDEGLLSEINYVGQKEKTFKLFYDLEDTLFKIETYSNNECTERLEFIYDENGWLTSTLTQTPENNHIIITKLLYKSTSK